MRRPGRRLSVRRIVAAAAATAALAARADDPGKREAEAHNPPAGEERPIAAAGQAPPRVNDAIVVTAQKREQPQREVPVSVLVLGSEAIERGRVQGIEEVAASTPSLEMNAFPNLQPRLWIRGIGSISRGAGGDPSVGVFLDEVYVGRPAGVAFDVFDVERVEVLRGPQGTLWGKNVAGGAVHLVTRKPGSRPGGRLSATAGDLDRREASGAFEARLGEEAAVRGAGSARRRRGHVRNATTGADLLDEDTSSLRGHLRLEPTERRVVLLTADATRDRPTGPARHVKALDAGDPASALWRVTSDDLDTVRADTDGFQSRTAGGVRIGLEDRLGDVALTSITAYRDLELETLEDFDGGSPATNPINIRLGDSEDASTFSQELRLAATSGRGPAWVLGLFYGREEIERASRIAVDNQLTGSPPGSFLLTNVFDQTNVTESSALFGDATFPLSGRMSLSAGLRFSRDAKDFAAVAGGTANLVSNAFYSVTSAASWSELTGRLALSFRASETTTLFATVATGHKAGGFQATPPTAESAVIPFAPEAALSHELGARLTTPGGRLTAAATAFLVDYEDLQVRQLLGLNLVTRNAGQAEIRGLELELSGRPHRRLEAGLSYARLDAEFLELTEEGRDLSGNRLPRAPEHDLTLFAGVTLPLDDRTALLLDGHYRHVGRIFEDNDNNPLEIRGARDEVDARAALVWGDYEIALWGQNLTDERFEVHQATFLGANFAIFSPPRSFGLTFRWTLMSQ